jgi:hypothetical protein
MKDSKKGLCKQSDCERADVASLTDALRAINTFTFFYSTPVGATPLPNLRPPGIVACTGL